MMFGKNSHPNSACCAGRPGDGGFKKWDLGPNVGLEALGDLGLNQAITGDSITVGDTLGAFVAVDLTNFESHVYFFDLAPGALVGQHVIGQQPVTALANDRFIITDPIADARVASSWSLYTPQTGERTQLANCEIDAASGVCLTLPGGTYDPSSPTTGRNSCARATTSSR
jgi:hypothetical protein